MITPETTPTSIPTNSATAPYRPRRLADIYSQPPYKLSLGADFRHIMNILRNRADPEREVKAELGIPNSYVLRPPPKVHHSVLDRVGKGTDGYAPIVLPEKFSLVRGDDTVVSNATVEPNPASRTTRAEKVWDWVWARRIVYFLTVFSSLFLAAMPLIEKWRPGRGPASLAEVVVPVVDFIGAFLPGFVKPWLDSFRNSPGRFLVGVLLVGAFMFAGGWLQGHIRDVMRRIWKSPDAPAVVPGGIVYNIRTSGPYRAFFYWLKHWALPTIFAALIFVVLVVIGFAIVNRVVFAAYDLTGNICAPSPQAPPVGGTATASFETKTLCTATRLGVEKGKSYRVTIVVTDPWEDGHHFKETNPEKARGIETDPRGFGFDKMRWTMAPGLPIRRLLASNWFATVLRIGNKGFGEVVLSWERNDAPPCLCPAKVTYTAKFKAKKSGELFVYVNDSVLGWPGYFDFFYTLNNKGAAELTLQPTDE